MEGGTASARAGVWVHAITTMNVMRFNAAPGGAPRVAKSIMDQYLLVTHARLAAGVSKIPVNLKVGGRGA
jgi:hypothetical protein